MPFYDRVCRIYGRILNALGYFSGIVAFLMMLMIVANAASRKIFNHPLEGTHEMTESSMVLIVFLALAYTQLKGGHIRVVLLTRFLPVARQHLFFFVALMIGCLFFGWASYGTLTTAIESFEVGERTWGNVPYPVWPLKFMISFGLALLSVQFLLDSIHEFMITTGRLKDGAVDLSAQGEM